VLLAAGSTFFAFATLAFSSTPVLGMIGQTVAIGAAAGLLVSMVFSADDPATSA
jgi:predicted exporter